MKAKVYLSFWFCLILISLVGQNQSGLVLEYDIYNNQVTYRRDGVVLEQPFAKENENIYVSVIEFNPYIMKAELQVKQSSYNQSSSQLDIGNLSEGNSTSGSLSGISNLLGGLNLGSVLQKGFSSLPSSRGASSEEAISIKNSFLQLSAELSEAEENLNQSSKKLQLYKTIEQSQKIAVEDIDKLKTNNLLRPSRIKELINEEVNHAFAKSQGEPITMTDLIANSNNEEQIKEAVNDYNHASKQYIEVEKKWNSFKIAMPILEEDEVDAHLEFIKIKSDSIHESILKNVKLNLNQPVTLKPLNSETSMNVNKLAALRQVHEEINGNIFTYSFPPVQAIGEVVELDIMITQKNEKGEYKNHKNLIQTIPISGSWKISAGIGLAFGVLKEKNYEYSIVNNAIVADELDDFAPLIVSFAHGYKKTMRNVNFGASFGVGFPLQNGSGIQSAAFFLGPTIIIGKNQKFLITTGLMGAKANRLSSGFNEGDSYTSTSNTLPITQRYEVGYFVSVSYDLLK